mgnify:CR=1 FL=1
MEDYGFSPSDIKKWNLNNENSVSKRLTELIVTNKVKKVRQNIQSDKQIVKTSNTAALSRVNKNEKFETIYFDKPIVVKALRLHSFKEVADRPVMTIAEFQPIFSKKKIPYKNTSLAELKHTRMAPSIHMNYGSPKAQAYYTEMSIKQSTAGSFFMTLGFDSGYFGLQEQKNGRKVVIFSVWDKFRGDDPKSVPDEKKVKVLYQNPDMARVGRFGGEGTGGQSFFEYDWQKGVKYRFYLSMKANGERNEYTAHFYLPEKKEWMKLVTFSTIAESAHLSRLHHFVEDFRRDFQSSKEVREAVYSNTYYREEKGEWKIPSQVRFTKDSNSQMNIDCLVNAETRHLITGGKTANVNVPLWHSTKIAPTRNDSVLTDLPVEK